MKKLFCPKCKKDKPSNGDFFNREDLDRASKRNHVSVVCKECIKNTNLNNKREQK
jgi:hypothetical protein